jgi:hypothetical protein
VPKSNCQRRRFLMSNGIGVVGCGRETKMGPKRTAAHEMDPWMCAGTREGQKIPFTRLERLTSSLSRCDFQGHIVIFEITVLVMPSSELNGLVHSVTLYHCELSSFKANDGLSLVSRAPFSICVGLSNLPGTIVGCRFAAISRKLIIAIKDAHLA